MRPYLIARSSHRNISCSGASSSKSSSKVGYLGTIFKLAGPLRSVRDFVFDGARLIDSECVTWMLQTMSEVCDETRTAMASETVFMISFKARKGRIFVEVFEVR